MSFIQIGEVVRIYYEEDWFDRDDTPFDEGQVIAIDGDLITVDFWDWIERWQESAFSLFDLFREGKEVLVPTQRGEIVQDFRDSGKA